MNPEQLRKLIAESFDGRDGARLGYLTLWWLHAFVNVFSGRLKKVLPFPMWFIGTDSHPFKLKFRKRPAGYWAAHVFAPIVLLFLFGALGEISRRIITGLF